MFYPKPDSVVGFDHNTRCPNWTPTREEKILTPIKAIRAKCLDCCGGQRQEVKLCPCTDCSLHPYRMGHRPKTTDKAAENQDEEQNEV